MITSTRTRPRFTSAPIARTTDHVPPAPVASFPPPIEIIGTGLYLCLFRQVIAACPCARSVLVIASNDAAARDIVREEVPSLTDLTVTYLGAYNP